MDIKSHYLAIVLALFIGIISIAPQLIFSFDLSYSGIQMFGTDAENYYVARVHEVQDGHPLLGNVFLPDKDKPYLIPGLGEIIIASIGWVVSMDAVKINVISKFIFPTILFLFVYFFTQKLFYSKSIAIISASFVLFGNNLTDGLRDIMGLFSFTTSQDSFLTYTRPINPQISTLFFFVSLYLLFKVTSENRRINLWEGIFLGILSGASLYVYIYSWSFLFVLFSFYFSYFLYKKNKENAKLFFSIIATNLVVTIPFWVNFFKAKAHQDYIDTSMRLGLVANHDAVFGIWLLLSLIVIIFLWPKEYQKAKIFFLFIITSLWVVTNQQILTGMKMQIGHYHWYITKPIIAIIISMFAIFLAKKLIRNKKAVTLMTIFLISILFYNGILIQLRSYQGGYAEAVKNQRYSAVIFYLEDHYDSSKNIWTNIELAELLSAYTKHNALNNRYAGNYLNSNEYFIKKLLLTYKLQDIRPEEVGEIIKKEKNMISGNIFGLYYREKQEDVPEDFLRLLENKYKSFYGLSYKEIFEDLDIELVVKDVQKDKNFAYENVSVLKKEQDFSGDFIIYRVN